MPLLGQHDFRCGPQLRCDVDSPSAFTSSLGIESVSNVGDIHTASQRWFCIGFRREEGFARLPTALLLWIGKWILGQSSAAYSSYRKRVPGE